MTNMMEYILKTHRYRCALNKTCLAIIINKMENKMKYQTKKYLVPIVLFSLSLIMALGLTGCAAPATPETTATSQAQASVPQTTPTTNVMPQRALSGSGSGTFASVMPTYTNLPYATVSPAQKLDLYIPTMGNGPFPMVLMVHGGGFMMGDKADGTGLAGVDQLLAAGYAVASINYRLSGEAKYPAQINDAKAAVRFLRANTAKYNLNPDRFGAWGASAGGNLVSLLGTTCGVTELEGADLGNADQSSCVQAVVDWFGPIDFLAMDEQFAGTSCPQNHNDASSPESQLVGALIQTVPDLVYTTNPMNYITTGDAPFLIQNGSADCNIPPVQGKNLADALSLVIGVDNVTYTLIDGAGHGGAQFSTAENLALVINFLDKYLK
jgi:acetyl esterase/lipase